MATDSLYPPDWRDAARKDWSRVSALLGLDDVEGAAFFLHMNDRTLEHPNALRCTTEPPNPRTLFAGMPNHRTIELPNALWPFGVRPCAA